MARRTKEIVAEAPTSDLEPEYEPTAEDQGMFGEGAPAKKAQHFWPSAKRLAGLLRPERANFIFVVILVVFSVILTVIAPKVLGQAMDVIFNGVLGKNLPAGVPLETVIQQARDSGNDQFADLLTGTNVVPGEGIDFGRLGMLILIVLGMYTVAAFLMWWQGYVLNQLVMRVVFRLRQDIEEKLNRLPLRYFDTRQRGDVIRSPRYSMRGRTSACCWRRRRCPWWRFHGTARRPCGHPSGHRGP